MPVLQSPAWVVGFIAVFVPIPVRGYRVAAESGAWRDRHKFMEILASRVLFRPADYERSLSFYRDGIALATSVDAYDITADPMMFTRATSRS